MNKNEQREANMIEKYKLPDGWKWVRLGEVCEVCQYGLTATATNEKGFPYIRITDIDDFGNIKIDAIKFVHCDENTYKKYELKEGDILFARSGSIGRTFLYRGIPPKSIFASYLIRFRLKQELISPLWLFYFTHSPQYYQFIEEKKHTVSQPNINAEEYKSLIIPLPSLPTQHRIAAKLKELMQEIDRAKTACEKQLEAANALPSAYLREIFESEEAKKWERKRLGEVCHFSSGKFIRKENIRPQGSYPVYGANGIIGFTENKLYDEEVIIVGRVGSCGIVNRTSGPSWITDNTIILKPFDQIYFEFLYWLLKSLKLKELGTASVQPLITQRDLKSLPVLLPPLQIQHRIAADLKEKMAYVEKLKLAIQNQKSAIDALPQAILRKAFRGEL